MWQKYFKFVNLVPGKVVIPRYGTIDFSRPDLPLETIQALYENDFPYLEITQQGLEELYGIEHPPQITETITPTEPKQTPKIKTKKMKEKR
jgi:hypothetical protein